MAKYPTFGSLLKSIRESHPKWGKISQTKFCKENKITQTWLSLVETDKAKMGENQLKKLAELYGVNYLELVIYQNKQELKTVEPYKRNKLKFFINELLEKFTNSKE